MKVLVLAVLCAVSAASGHEAANPLFDAARQLLENSLSGGGQDGGGGANVAQGLMQGLFGALAASKDGGAGAADLIGGLLAAAGGGGAGGQQPDLLAAVADMFSQQAAGGHVQGHQGRQAEQEQGFDWENMIGMASSFMASQGGGGQNQGAEGLLTLLPLFMGGGQTGTVLFIHSMCYFITRSD
jgi:hypothetical protein